MLVAYFAGIAHRLWVTEGTVEKHVRSISTKLDIREASDDHSRVLAVITFLEARRDPEEIADGVNGERELGHEAQRRARGHHVGEFHWGVGGNQYQRGG